MQYGKSKSNNGTSRIQKIAPHLSRSSKNRLYVQQVERWFSIYLSLLDRVGLGLACGVKG